jgi:hypothetical protein
MLTILNLTARKALKVDVGIAYISLSSIGQTIDIRDLLTRNHST